PFPLPYREGSGTNATSDTLADIAMYYWIHDLRPDLPDQVKDSVAPWQHVVFYGLSLGAEGTLDYPSAIGDITNGTVQWPKPLVWQATTIDDLWHASINGRGDYITAQNYQQPSEGIVRITQLASQQAGTATAVGLPGAQLTATKSFAYRTSYE